ncbi:MAG: GNAT family N-acetyltransferase [Candidatus Melainabacteria bacterium]
MATELTPAMKALTCRPYQPEDWPTFYTLAETTFRETFEAKNDPVQFERYMAAHFTPAAWQAHFEDPGYHVCLCETADSLAGYFTLNTAPPAYPEITGAQPVEIVRFYLDSAFHGSGLAGEMMAHALEQARRLSADTVWLGVWEHNPRASRFYEKHGFTRVGRHDYWMGDDCQNDELMLRGL